jgi:hypothetical protein
VPKILTVTYEELFNTGNYENVRLGVTMAIGPNETARETMSMARDHIHDEFRRLGGMGIKLPNAKRR